MDFWQTLGKIDFHEFEKKRKFEPNFKELKEKYEWKCRFFRKKTETGEVKVRKFNEKGWFIKDGVANLKYPLG